MKKRILISPNSFKECADSVSIAELIRDNLVHLKDTELIMKPISDGGDGFLNVCRFYFGGEIRNYSISTSYDNSSFECPVLYCEKRKEIYIESAEVLGLKVVPLVYRNPLKLSSRGLGELLLRIEADIQNRKIKAAKVYIGVGGTATIDMGIGMMSELGLNLVNASGKELNVIPENYHLAEEINYKPSKFSFEFIPVIDVTNTLFGERGGIRMFSIQKGANKRNISDIEESFNHLLKLFENNDLRIFSNGLSGAGGGIPAAFQIFYKTGLLSSSEFIENNLGIRKYAAEVDYLITGEGTFDSESNFGKGAGILIDLLKEKVQRIFLLCGRISGEVISCLPKNVYFIEMNKFFSNEKESIANYKEGISKSCKEIIKELSF